MEPNVSGTAARVNVLMECKRRGIPTVVWMTPILPFINDTEENINGLLDYCIEAGVRGIISFGIGVTLREGDREYFYTQLDRHFPGVKQRYIDAFGLNYDCNSPNGERLMAFFRNAARPTESLPISVPCSATWTNCRRSRRRCRCLIDGVTGTPGDFIPATERHKKTAHHAVL